MSSNHYFLGTGEVDKIRLQIMNEVYNPHSQKFLQTIGIKTGQKILDIGCGNGSMSSWLAEQVGHQGFVTAVDLSEEQIDLARQNASHLGINNIEFKVVSAYDLTQLEQQFDVAYCRFLLAHLTNPKAAIKAAYAILKPGGIFACESAIHSHCYSDPEVRSYDFFIKSVKQLLTAQGKDYDIGKSLFSLFNQVGFKVGKICNHQPLLVSAREKSIMSLALQNLQAFLLQEDIMTQQEIDTLIQQLVTDSQALDSIWAPPSVCQIVAYKSPKFS